MSTERPKMRGRPPKHYHLLLQKEKEIATVVQRILPKEIAQQVIQKGSRLAHLYGLPKTHKHRLAMRPILSATGTYNFKLAKWLDEKIKPLSTNSHTISDIFEFVDALHDIEVDDRCVLVSYDITSLFTNVPVDETIAILAEKAFQDNWFNKEHILSITKAELVELLNNSTKHQLFQFEGNLYEQIDGVAMGSPLGPLMANAFMCSIEDRLEEQGKMPGFYKRYVDGTLSIMADTETAEMFLATLNESHPSVSFTMELAVNGKLSFLGTEIMQRNCRLETKVYKKPSDTDLLLHYQSHVDVRYKQSLLKTMVNRAFKLSSKWQFFHQECERLTETFSRLKYPTQLLHSTINDFITKKVSGDPGINQTSDEKKTPVRIILPFKDQTSANSVRRQLGDLSRKIGTDISPVYTNRKIGYELKPTEKKPNIINQQRVVYYFKCGLCDADYVGYTCRHLYQRAEEHKASQSSIGNHIKERHGHTPSDLHHSFKILKKCKSKLDCLIYEMLFIKEIKPSLNKQSDSMRAKLFL
ncbi:uncharacterized protein LOC111328527 [Stylophora pistillata]|uniref:uncharacterized protein LOC111328527 n=1 Tax=Stylophora pistillata TaxID=50429 RepID=UPI000C04058A|nr:uncharacterized protein LOC111328527 [Stylophora pistillata]